MEYVLEVFLVVGIFAIAAMSLDILVGHAGLLPVSHGALFGIGAYTGALMALRVGTPFIVNALAGMAITAAGAALVALPGVRLRGDAFIIATFAFQVAVTSTLTNWSSMTGGPAGLAGVPAPDVFGLRLSSPTGFASLVGISVILAGCLYQRVTRSPFGRVLRCLREDEVVAQCLGKAVMRTKVTVFAFSGAIVGLAGVLFAYYLTFIDPTSFSLTESVFILSIVIVGGAGGLRGPILGAVVLVSLPEALRFLGLPVALAANVRQILYGSLLVVMMMFRPRGLAGRFGFLR